jgi:hypothetical protein
VPEDASLRVPGAAALTIAGLLAAGLAGCGESGPETGTVKGAVTFKSAPLTAGTVNFYNKETAAAAQAALDESGRFTVASPLKTGTYLVFVFPPAPPAPVMKNPNDPPLKLDTKGFPDVPQKYRSDRTTDIKVEVKAGANDVKVEIPEK